METYGRILLIAMPFFLLLVLGEMYYTIRVKKQKLSHNDIVSSLMSGVTNVTKDVLGLSIVVITYAWLVEQIALFHIENKWIVYALAFIALDFSGYCTHLLQHKINLFWNGHLVHHSSEEFNLACALRQSISNIINLFVVFLIPAALLGVPAKVIAVVAPLHLFAQFWYHTMHIKKMGFLEKIIVTPSHHRVHHAINPEYLDKNFSQIFIIWDKMFGTFQEEIDGVPAVFGITRPVRTWNPLKINFQHVWLLLQDAWRTNSWRDKLRIWFMPTGWRPADVQEKYPVYKIDDFRSYQKYGTTISGIQKIFLWAQLVILLLTISYLFANIASIGSPAIYVYGLYVFLFVYAQAELMDGAKNYWVWATASLLLGLGLAVWLQQMPRLAIPNFFLLPIVTILIAHFAIGLIVGKQNFVQDGQVKLSGQ